MYSTLNKGKSFAAGKCISTLNNKHYKHMTAVSKNVYTDNLDDIVNEYNNTYHRTIKILLKQLKLEIIHILTLFKKLTIKIQI